LIEHVKSRFGEGVFKKKDDELHPKVKLPALNGGASRQGSFLLYCAPLLTLKDGACGAHAGQQSKIFWKCVKIG